MSRLRNRFLLSQLLAIVLLGVFFWPTASALSHQIWIVVGTFFVFYLPGYWLSLWFFRFEELSSFERIVTSLAIGVVLMGLGILYIKLCGVEISSGAIVLICWARVVLSFIGLAVSKP